MKQLTFISIVLFSFLSFGQKIEKNLYLKHSFKQDNQSFQFTVRDSDKKDKKHFQKDKFYYWFKSQKVMMTQGGASGLLLDGLFESFYENNQLSQKGKFKNGLKNGEWLYWTNTGILVRKENWINGVKRGEEIVYDANGIPLFTTDYKRFKSIKTTQDSIVTIYRLKDKKRMEFIDQNGKVISSQLYLNGSEKVKKESRFKLKKEDQNGTQKSKTKQQTKSDKEKKKIDVKQFFKKKEKSTESNSKKEKGKEKSQEKEKFRLFPKKKE